MPEPPLESNSNDLKAFQAIVADSRTNSAMLASWIPRLVEKNLLDQALQNLKQEWLRLSRDEHWRSFRTRLESELQRIRERRMQQWQLDPRRRTLRLQLEIRTPACGMHPQALLQALAKAVQATGLPLATSLEKHPRPMVRMGHPLPLGVEGLCEWVDMIFSGPTQLAGTELVEGINAHCVQGLRISGIETIPNHASPVLDLCHEARWTWPCPQELREHAARRMAGFMSAESFEIEKTGKVDGHKQSKRVEVRHLVTEMDWMDSDLRFTTRLSTGTALNPVKWLAGVLDLEPSTITGLVRTAVVLVEDARLGATEKYAPKLHNIFEDAVLLESDSHIQIIDEDDDEPIVLRKDDPR